MNAKTPFSIDPTPFAIPPEQVVAAAASELSRLRQRRRRLPTDELSDTEWAMLLEVFVADACGLPVTLTQLTPISGVPSSTALRYARQLEAKLLVEVAASETDKRVQYISMAPGGRALVERVYDRSVFDWDEPARRAEVVR